MLFVKLHIIHRRSDRREEGGAAGVPPAAELAEAARGRRGRGWREWDRRRLLAGGQGVVLK